MDLVYITLAVCFFFVLGLLITGSAQALLNDAGKLAPAERRELLETIREEGDRLSRLVANLLDLTRLESGSLEVQKEWCPVDEVVHSAIGRLAKTLGDRQVVLVLPEEVLLAPVDPVLIEQVLVNLIENSCKYSPPGSPIEVAVRAGDHEAIFEVSDRGSGIPPGEEQRIFEKFYRAGTNIAEGSGLGLAVAQAIVAAHGGTISAENRHGGGALVRFRIPVQGDVPAEPALAGESVK